MTQSQDPLGRKAFLLAPEEPALDQGGGPLRAAMVLAYLERHYEVTVGTFALTPHSKTIPARAIRNARRLIQGLPPLFDRFAGYQKQISRAMSGERYKVGVVEHLWCASYANLLRPHCDRLVLDLHNVESQLARSHAQATRGAAAWASDRFATAYETLEREWLPKFDVVLVASDRDRDRIQHRDIRVFPNAIPETLAPDAIEEQEVVAFSGNLAYHPNVEAVRWFRNRVWPRLKERAPQIEWHLIGRNGDAVASLIAGDPRIRMIGPVDDALVALAAAKVCIVPLLSGSGTRFKILEAWGAKKPVVSTTIGAEGLQAIDGQHLVLADGPNEFVDAIVLLLRDAAARRKLGECGRALLEERYTWPAAFRAMDASDGL